MVHSGKGEITDCSTWPELRLVNVWAGLPQEWVFGAYRVKTANVYSTQFVRPGDYCRIA